MRDGWIETTVSHLLECSIGGVWGSDPGTSEVDVCVYRQTEFDDDGKLTMPSEAIRSMTRSQLKSRALQPGDVLMQKSAGTPSLPGRVVRVRDGIENDSTCSNFLQLLRADQSVCNSDYLFWLLWMGHRTGRAFEFQRGTNIRNLDLNQYLIQPVLLPPLQEQKRIVDVVSAVDEYIAALQRQADAARTARNAVLHEMLTASGDDWVEKSLGEVAEASWGNTSVTKSAYIESGYIAFSASGPDGFVDWFEHDGEGVVLSAIGALCGKTWLARGRWTPIKNTIWFKSTSKSVMTEFLFLVTSPRETWPIRGQAQPFISLGDVRLVDVRIPSRDLQERIVETISSMDQTIQELEATTSEARALRSGLLSDLLSGEHEIPDSYDRLLGAA